MLTKSLEAIEQIANPWSDDRRPVYRLIVEAYEARGSACTSFRIEPPHRLAEFTFGPGSADSLIGLPDPSTQQATARPIVDAILDVVRRPSRVAARRFYDALCGQETISNVDTVLSMLRPELGDHAPAAAALARRLMREAPISGW